jgi:hypothetical protein
MAPWTLRGLLGGLLISLFSLTVMAQGLSFEILEGEDDQAQVEKGLYMPGMFRQEDENGHVSILRLDKGLMISINQEKRTYTETTFKEFEAFMKQSQVKADEAMKSQLAGMPPEQRKELERQMAAMTGRRVAAKVEVVETGKRRSIDGYSCAGYTVKRDGKEIETVWATRDIPNFSSIRKDFQRIGSIFNSITGGHSAFASLEKIDGFPIERIETDGAREKITKIKKGSFPASAFKIPAGYTKEDSSSEEDEE